MAMTKINFYIALILIVGTLSVVLMNVGQDLLVDSNYNLDEKSIEYIATYSGIYNTQGLSNITDTDLTDIKEKKIILLDNETGASLISDNLAELEYNRRKYYGIVNYIKMVYNFPTFILGALGLPVYAFRPVLNVLGLALFIGVAVMLWRLLRGG